MRFVLVNESTTSAASLGGLLTPDVLQDIAVAISWQLNGDVAAEWGGVGTYSLRVGKNDGSDVQASEIAIWIKDALPDAPGAAGYHDRLPNGAPVVYIGRDGSNSLTRGVNALSVTISHECCEAAGDPPANFWADRGDGNEEALELCDRVEDTTYPAPNGVALSNFLLRASFDPGAPAVRQAECPQGAHRHDTGRVRHPADRLLGRAPADPRRQAGREGAGAPGPDRGPDPQRQALQEEEPHVAHVPSRRSALTLFAGASTGNRPPSHGLSAEPTSGVVRAARREAADATLNVCHLRKISPATMMPQRSNPHPPKRSSQRNARSTSP
jgi:hypothetical protein